MAKRGKKGARTHKQYAALPVRLSSEGRLEVLLLTSRETRRWVIPKGWPMRKLSPGAAAAREAYEEAGLKGTIVSEKPIGHYRYDKHGSGQPMQIEVGVFLLKVSQQLADWPEQAERQTLWCDPEQAAELVAEPELAAILRDVRGFELGL